MKEDEECMLTEFDRCNSKNQSSVAGADTFSETKEDCDNKDENAEEESTAWLKEELTAWLLVLVVFFLLWTSMLAKFS